MLSPASTGWDPLGDLPLGQQDCVTSFSTSTAAPFNPQQQQQTQQQMQQQQMQQQQMGFLRAQYNSGAGGMNGVGNAGYNPLK